MSWTSGLALRREKMIPSMIETPNTKAEGSFREIDHTKALRLGLCCANRPESRQSELSWCHILLVCGVTYSKIYLTAWNRTCNQIHLTWCQQYLLPVRFLERLFFFSLLLLSSFLNRREHSYLYCIIAALLHSPPRISEAFLADP